MPQAGRLRPVTCSSITSWDLILNLIAKLLLLGGIAKHVACRNGRTLTVPWYARLRGPPPSHIIEELQLRADVKCLMCHI